MWFSKKKADSQLVEGKSPHFLAADRPISQRSEDRLNRPAFAQALGESIDGPDGLVVGIYGNWGAGKTSLVDIIEEENRSGWLRRSEGGWHASRRVIPTGAEPILDEPEL